MSDTLRCRLMASCVGCQTHPLRANKLRVQSVRYLLPFVNTRCKVG
ncbi:MAG: hypothetical protein LBK25_00990 [Treponema sp.]|nr:hypothetical protein [Treponema sp.]